MTKMKNNCHFMYSKTKGKKILPDQKKRKKLRQKTGEGKKESREQNGFFGS